MKQAYVSLVLVNHLNETDWSQIELIDDFLSNEARKHEIVLVTKKPIFDHFVKPLKLKGPLTVVTVQSTGSTSDLIIAGLGRSVGDFVVEWNLNTSKIESGTIAGMLIPSNEGNELIECVPIRLSLSTQCFYKLVNQLRPPEKSVSPSVARVYSRRALNWLLEANRYESHIMVLAAEMPFQKVVHVLPLEGAEGKSLKERVVGGFTLLIKGSRFGTVIPLLLAGISSLFAISVAIYALADFLISGDAAEGWTSIAVVMGFGQGAILALFGLVWSRLDSLANGLSKRNDATINTEVYPAKF
jgi:hypothetical protein